MFIVQTFDLTEQLKRLQRIVTILTGEKPWSKFPHDIQGMLNGLNHNPAALPHLVFRLLENEVVTNGHLPSHVITEVSDCHISILPFFWTKNRLNNTIAENLLSRGIITISMLRQWSSVSLGSLRGLGPKTVEQITDVMNRIGLSLTESTRPF